MIDFSNCEERLNSYKGSEKKKTLIYEGKKYLVKFPDPIREKNKDISYINNAFSEYVGSNIFNIILGNAQNTLLGTYKYKDYEKVVCACLDFTNEEKVLYEFENLALSIMPDKKIDTEISSLMEAIEIVENMPNIKIEDNIKERFWDMFIVDSIIGNTNRHNGNWGLLLDTKNKTCKFSPIYDCGSCLNPILDDEQIEKLSFSDIKNLAINCYSCLKENGKKINYMTYIKETKNEDCNKALLRVFDNINLDKINLMLDNMLYISDTRRNFYKNLIKIRVEILKGTKDKLLDL